MGGWSGGKGQGEEGVRESMGRADAEPPWDSFNLLQLDVNGKL